MTSFLASNATLPGTDYLGSAPTGAYFLAVSTSGDLCVFHRPAGAVSPTPIWRTQYQGANHIPANSFLVMQTDGNFCWYSGSPSGTHSGIWCTSTAEIIPAPPAPPPTPAHPVGFQGKAANTKAAAALPPIPNFAIMQEDGNLCVYSGTASNTPNGANTPSVNFLWGTHQHPVSSASVLTGAWPAPQAANRGSYLLVGQYLNINEYLVSPSGLYYAILQADGNFCIYHGSGPGGNPDKACYWALNHSQPAGGYFITLDSNSMLSLYSGTGTTNRLWQGGTPYTSNPHMETGKVENLWQPDVVCAVMQDDGNLVIYHGNPDPSANDTYALWSWAGAAAGSSSSGSPGGAGAMAALQAVTAMFPAYTLP